MLVIKARVGDIIQIGDTATIRIAEKEGQWIGLQFNADRSVPIRRYDTRGDEGPRQIEMRQVPATSDPMQFGPPSRVSLGILAPKPRKLKAG